MAEDRVKMIRQRLTAALAPGRLEIRDDSARHAGHPGARAGGGHFAVYIVSERFAGKSLLERHRAVYEAMGDAMRSDIHALSIQAVTPEEETKP
jgi:BolA protein